MTGILTPGAGMSLTYFGGSDLGTSILGMTGSIFGTYVAVSPSLMVTAVFTIFSGFGVTTSTFTTPGPEPCPTVSSLGINGIPFPTPDVDTDKDVDDIAFEMSGTSAFETPTFGTPFGFFS